jgi:hypothetical protein
MGQLLEFYGGDPKVVGTAFSAFDFDTLADRTKIPLYVDFSLHLSPMDFDFLTAEAVGSVGKGPSEFMDCLATNVGGSDGESSADVVSPEWVRLIAAVPDAEVEAVATRWAKALAEEYGDPQLKVTAEMLAALRSLVALCRESLRMGLPVIHAWSL